MNRRETDRRITEALRANAPPKYEHGRLAALARRIEDAARPLLDQRRFGVREGSWWNFAAAWAGTLIPVGVTVAVASIALLWIARPPVLVSVAEASSVSPAVILGAARAAAPQRDLIDLAVEEIVRPPRIAAQSRGNR